MGLAWGVESLISQKSTQLLIRTLWFSWKRY